jgi:hypothetical protein
LLTSEHHGPLRCHRRTSSRDAEGGSWNMTRRLP